MIVKGFNYLLNDWTLLCVDNREGYFSAEELYITLRTEQPNLFLNINKVRIENGNGDILLEY